MAVPLLQAAEVSQSQIAKHTARPEVPHVLCPSRALPQYLSYIHVMVKLSYPRQSQAVSPPLGSRGTSSCMPLEHARVRPLRVLSLSPILCCIRGADIQ